MHWIGPSLRSGFHRPSSSLPFLRKTKGVWTPAGRCDNVPRDPRHSCNWVPFHCTNYFFESCWKGLWAIIKIMPYRITFTNVITWSFRAKWHCERTLFPGECHEGRWSASCGTKLSETLSDASREKVAEMNLRSLIPQWACLGQQPTTDFMDNRKTCKYDPSWNSEPALVKHIWK